MLENPKITLFSWIKKVSKVDLLCTEVPAADVDLQRAGAAAGQRVLALLQGHLRGGLGDRHVHHGHLPPRYCFNFLYIII